MYFSNARQHHGMDLISNFNARNEPCINQHPNHAIGIRCTAGLIDSLPSSNNYGIFL